jgi:hypothetical protein
MSIEQMAAALLAIVAGEEAEAQATACLTEAGIVPEDPDRVRYEMMHLRIYACVTAVATRWERTLKSTAVTLKFLESLSTIVESPDKAPAFRAAINRRLVQYGEAHEQPHPLGQLGGIGAVFADLAGFPGDPALTAAGKAYYILLYTRLHEFLGNFEVVPADPLNP